MFSRRLWPELQFKVLSVHSHIIDHAIPLALGITFSTMVVLAVYKDTLEVNSIFYMYPGTAVSTFNILNVFFFHNAPKNQYEYLSYSWRSLGLCMDSPIHNILNQTSPIFDHCQIIFVQGEIILPGNI